MISGDSVILVTVDGEVIELDHLERHDVVGRHARRSARPDRLRQPVRRSSGRRRRRAAAPSSTTRVRYSERSPTCSPSIPGSTNSRHEPRTASRSCDAVSPTRAWSSRRWRTASIVAEATADVPMLSTVDGCTVVAIDRVGPVRHRSERASPSMRADGDLLALAPDGQRAVTESTANRLLLTDLTVTAATPADTLLIRRRLMHRCLAPVHQVRPSGESGRIDLGPASRLVLFTRR